MLSNRLLLFPLSLDGVNLISSCELKNRLNLTFCGEVAAELAVLVASCRGVQAQAGEVKQHLRKSNRFWRNARAELSDVTNKITSSSWNISQTVVLHWKQCCRDQVNHLSSFFGCALSTVWKPIPQNQWNNMIKKTRKNAVVKDPPS